MTTGNWMKGMVAGFVATMVLSALMAMMGVMAELNATKMIADMLAGPPAVGWTMLNRSLPGGSQWLKGIAFAVGAWLVMTVMMRPMAGAALFDMSLVMMTPVMTLMLHVVFGFVLGAIYALERPDTSRALRGARA